MGKSKDKQLLLLGAVAVAVALVIDHKAKKPIDPPVYLPHEILPIDPLLPVDPPVYIPIDPLLLVDPPVYLPHEILPIDPLLPVDPPVYQPPEEPPVEEVRPIPRPEPRVPWRWHDQLIGGLLAYNPATRQIVALQDKDIYDPATGQRVHVPAMHRLRELLYEEGWQRVTPTPWWQAKVRYRPEGTPEILPVELMPRVGLPGRPVPPLWRWHDTPITGIPVFNLATGQVLTRGQHGWYRITLSEAQLVKRYYRREGTPLIIPGYVPTVLRPVRARHFLMFDPRTREVHEVPMAEIFRHKTAGWYFAQGIEGRLAGWDI